MKAFSKVGPITRFVLCGCVVWALALTICVRQSLAQAKSRRAETHADPALVKRGAQLFQYKACWVCHTIGRSGEHTAEGPDLGGVTDRRTHEWLVAWLKDPNAMFGNDPVADAMLKQYHNVKMPNMKLNDSDITAIIAYLSEHH
jgi:mono/diheme cytochrome c family protein